MSGVNTRGTRERISGVRWYKIWATRLGYEAGLRGHLQGGMACMLNIWGTSPTMKRSFNPDPFHTLDLIPSYPGSHPLVPRISSSRTPDLIPSYPGSHPLVPWISSSRTPDLTLSYPGSSPDLDFHALEQSTLYADGYCDTSEVRGVPPCGKYTLLVVFVLKSPTKYIGETRLLISCLFPPSNSPPSPPSFPPFLSFPPYSPIYSPSQYLVSRYLPTPEPIYDDVTTLATMT